MQSISHFRKFVLVIAIILLTSCVEDTPAIKTLPREYRVSLEQCPIACFSIQDNVPVFEDPSEKSGIIYELSEGELVIVREYFDNNPIQWAKIETPNGVVGWVSVSLCR